MNPFDLKTFTINRITLFKKIGLLSSFSELTSKEIYNELDAIYKLNVDELKEFMYERGIDEDSLKQRICLEILLLDKSSHFFNLDNEWVYEEGDYTRFIRELIVSTKGYFESVEIVEKWTEGPKIEIKVKTTEWVCTIQPKVNRDWADIDTILKSMNKYLKSHSFLYFTDEELIVFLTTKQIEELRTNRVNLIEPK